MKKVNMEDVLCEQLVRFLGKLSKEIKYHINVINDEKSSSEDNADVVKAMEDYVASRTEISKAVEAESTSSTEGSDDTVSITIEARNRDDIKLPCYKEMRRLIKRKKYKAFDRMVEEIVLKGVSNFINSEKFDDLVTSAIKDEIINRIEDAKYDLCSSPEESVELAGDTPVESDDKSSRFCGGCMGSFVSSVVISSNNWA